MHHFAETNEDIPRAAFDVDDDRTYLMGLSRGGAGTCHLAVTHPERWAASAAIAPAAFGPRGAAEE